MSAMERLQDIESDLVEKNCVTLYKQPVFIVGIGLHGLNKTSYPNLTEDETLAWINWYKRWAGMTDDEHESYLGLVVLGDL